MAEAARLARDDDVVLIASGEYRSDVALWMQKRLTIRGTGQRPVIYADGKSSEGKATWVIRNGDFTVSNIEFRGGRESENSDGAGIRFENGKLTVVDCAFIDNQVGILTGNHSGAVLTIENSVFGLAPKSVTWLPHLLYAGRIALLRVTGSRFHGGYRGHLLKSRARISDIRNNLLVDGEGGSASYEADFPNGGEVTLVGNVLGQSKLSQNPTIVAYGAEGAVWPQNRLKMVHNTIYSEGPRPAWFLHVFIDNFSATPEVMTRNNLLAGIGRFTALVPGKHSGNYFAPASVFANPAIMDFALGADSWLRGTVNPITPDPERLQPEFEPSPVGKMQVIRGTLKWAPGAVQLAAPLKE